MNNASDLPRAGNPSSYALGIMIFAFWLTITTSNCAMAAAQTPAVDADRENLPMGNEEFADIVSRGQITQRFEIYNPHSEEQLQTLKDMGFTQVILDWPQLHAAATRIGLDVVMANWWTSKSKIQEIEKSIELTESVDPRHLAAVSMMDEPERYAPDTPFSYYQSLYKDLRAHLDKELPNVKLDISHWGPLASWTPEQYQAFIPLYQATDRIRLMPYPDLFEGPLSEVYYQMIRSRRLMQMAGRELPQVVILQTWVLPDEPKLPTIDELRVMAYQAMLAGADTVSFFNYDPTVWQGTAGFTEGFATLMQELKDFSRRYRGAIVESRMSSTGLLTATIEPSTGGPISVVVNTNRTAIDGLKPLAVSVKRPPQTEAVASCVRQCVSRCRPTLIRRVFGQRRQRFRCRR